MQRLTCAAWSLDDRFVYSGSDEMNIRIWKARAAEKLGVVSLLFLQFSRESFPIFSNISFFCVCFRSKVERRYLCKSTPNWWKNSHTIQPSRRLLNTDTFPNMFTTAAMNYEMAGLQPDESTNYFLICFLFAVLICFDLF